MTGGWDGTLVAAAAVLVAAAVLSRPATGPRSRWRAAFGVGGRCGGPAVAAAGRRATATLGAVLRDRYGPGYAAAAGGLLAGLTAGPVAGIATAVYAALGVRAVARRTADRADEQRRAEALDGLCALAADLRAGLPPGAAAPAPIRDDARIRRLAEAVWRLADQTGAPVAELVERVAADLRAAGRARAAAAAQAAGARATAWLLAGLPVGGIALGYGIGVDPLAVLLHTPIGAACAAGALVLQTVGLAWADRLSRVDR